MTTAPNAQAKGLNTERVRLLITAYLQGDHPLSDGVSLRNFCLRACEPPVDPSNISDFLNLKRHGVSAKTAASLARGLALRPSDLYDGADYSRKARKTRDHRLAWAAGEVVDEALTEAAQAERDARGENDEGSATEREERDGTFATEWGNVPAHTPAATPEKISPKTEAGAA